MTITDLIPWRRPSSLVVGGETNPLFSLQREMNRMFDDVWGSGLRSNRGVFAESFQSVFPELDIRESEDKVQVFADIPGLTEKDMKVIVGDDGATLTLEGEKKTEATTERAGVHASERRYGNFRRIVALPTRVDTDKVEAKYKDGVLRIDMRKLPEQQQRARQIPIRTA